MLNELESDGFLHLLRTAFFENKTEQEDYISNPSDYISVLRVTPPSGHHGPAYPPPQFKARVSTLEVGQNGVSHEDLQSALDVDLKGAVMGRYFGTHPHVKEMEMLYPNYDNGYDCIDGGTICGGDNQDLQYTKSATSIAESMICMQLHGSMCPIANRTTLQEDGSDFFIVTGINHNATRSALYSSISMYNVDRLQSVGSFSSVFGDMNSFIGSADSYLTTNKSHLAEYLYVVKVTRVCNAGEHFCLQVTTSGNNALPLQSSCLFVERIYMDEMKAGPTKEATIKPTIYHFSSKLY